MKVQEWLSGLEYDADGMTIEKTVNNSQVIIFDIKGWSTIVNSLGNEHKAALFQDSVGEFILEAINEKLQNDKEKDRVWKLIVGSKFKIINKIKFLFLVTPKPVGNKFQLSNLDWCRLIKEGKQILVENEHGSKFSLNELDDIELELALQSIK